MQATNRLLHLTSRLKQTINHKIITSFLLFSSKCADIYIWTQQTQTEQLDKKMIKNE